MPRRSPAPWGAVPHYGRVRSLAKLGLGARDCSLVTLDLWVSVAEKLNDLSRPNILGGATDTPDC